MRKTLATLIAVPMLLFGVAFAQDLGVNMDQPGTRSDTGVESSQTREDTSSAIEQQKEAQEQGDEYKAPEASTKSSLPEWLKALSAEESPYTFIAP